MAKKDLGAGIFISKVVGYLGETAIQKVMLGGGFVNRSDWGYMVEQLFWLSRRVSVSAKSWIGNVLFFPK